MTTTSRREEYSSNIVRTLHPTTNNNFGESIDYLLDDLQHGVSGTSQFLASKNVQHLSPANTTSIIKERSVSPGRSSNVYKTSNYQYSTSSTETAAGNSSFESTNQNANQLDTLLQDLKKERELTQEKDYTSLSGLETVLDSKSRSSNVNRSRIVEDKVSIKRDFIFDPLETSTSTTRWNVSTSPSEKQNSRHYENKTETSTRDFSYGDKSEIRQNPTTLSRSEKYIENRTVPIVETITTRQGDFSEDLKNVPLSDDILPVPGTKVTTTVRTYTYEIPAEHVQQSNRTLLYKKEVNNELNSSYPEHDVPSSIIFKTESYGITDTGNVPPVKSTKTIIKKHDIKDSSNVCIDKNVSRECKVEEPAFSTTERSVHYQQDVSDTNQDVFDSPRNNGPEGPVTYYYKHHESTNTTNTVYGPNGQPIDQYYPSPTPSRNLYPEPAREPSYPGSKTIKYNTYSSTQTRKSEREPLLQPAPFPTDSSEPIGQSGGPPKRLDDLLASLGNGNVNSKQTDIETYKSRKEVDTSVATAERPPLTKNVAGPPVYYPPGKEMFIKKEESSAAYKAQGGYARAAGKYEYEAESRSKSKSKSGAAMVPVCLPLCCAMPCSIM